jgi:hypothetical protein
LGFWVFGFLFFLANVFLNAEKKKNKKKKKKKKNKKRRASQGTQKYPNFFFLTFRWNKFVFVLGFFWVVGLYVLFVGDFFFF